MFPKYPFDGTVSGSIEHLVFRRSVLRYEHDERILVMFIVPGTDITVDSSVYILNVGFSNS